MNIQILFSKIYKVFNECSFDGWAGDDSKAISADVLNHALKFSDWLVNFYSFMTNGEISEPEVSSEPDGSIVFEWYRSQDELMSVSISSDGAIYWAELFNERKFSGRF